VKLAESLENGCNLIGATGVEDKLQEKVPETIHDLLSASFFNDFSNKF
jgi:magnesium-transporting ATPase (P-type)